MRTLSILLLALLTMAGCTRPPEIHVSDGYVRLAAAAGRPAVGYFNLHGGPADTTLLSVSTDVAIKTELHESMSAGGMSTMKPIGDVKLPAGATVEFKPGGRHIMIFDLNPGITAGKTVTLLFTFSNGLRIEYDARVIAAGWPVPKK